MIRISHDWFGITHSVAYVLHTKICTSTVKYLRPPLRLILNFSQIRYGICTTVSFSLAINWIRLYDFGFWVLDEHSNIRTEIIFLPISSLGLFTFCALTRLSISMDNILYPYQSRRRSSRKNRSTNLQMRGYWCLLISVYSINC